MDLLITVIACLLTAIICNVVFYFRSVMGDMDIQWDNEKQVWDAMLHIPSTIDYSKVKKLIIKVNQK